MPSMRRVVRRVLIGGAALAAVVLLLAAAVYFISARRLGRVHTVEVLVPRSIPSDPASVARGEHIARAIASCALCHGDDLGGQMLGPPDPVATLAAPNLTKGEGGL